MESVKGNLIPYATTLKKLEARSNTPLSNAFYKMADDSDQLENVAYVRTLIRNLPVDQQIKEINLFIQDATTVIRNDNEGSPPQINANFIEARMGLIGVVTTLVTNAISKKTDMTPIAEQLFSDEKKRQDFLLRIQQADHTQPISLESLGVIFD